MRTMCSLIFASAVAISVAAQTPSLRPGLYEMTSEISMSGRAMKMPARKDDACISAADAKDLSKTLVKDDEKRNCTRSNAKATETTLAFTKECTSADGLTMTYTGDVTFTSAESYRAIVTMKDTSGRATNPMMRGSTITTTAKRIGDCAK